MKPSLDEILAHYKNRLDVILGGYIGNFIFPDKNQDKALLVIPDKRYGSNYPPVGTTLQDDKVGVVLRLSSGQNARILLNDTDMKIKVSIFSNTRMDILTDVWNLIFNSPLPVLGEPTFQSGTIDPVVKNFLVFYLLVSI
jgi:hypothetical protein